MRSLVTDPIRPNRLRPFHHALLRALPWLALGIAVFAAGPLHAQSRAVVHKVPPVYPPIARQMHIAGAILVSVTIDATGKVTKAESTSGNKLLVGAAIDAVKQWKFAPGDGTETMTVTINFENS